MRVRASTLAGYLPRLLLAVAAILCCTVAPAAAADPGIPVVTTEVATAVTSTSATIEVSIDPQGLETSYEIWLECRGTGDGCEAVASPERHVGVLAASSGAQTVTDEMNGLQPGSYYRYAVIARNSAGREGWVGVGLNTCPSSGPCPSQSVPGGTGLWVWEAARLSAEEAPAREAARQAAKREGEERLAREAAVWAARELAARQAGERAGREAAEREARARGCVVPHLAGESLAAARRSLAAAHCALGRVSAPHRSHGALVVSRQGMRAGQRLSAGSRVSVTLAPRHR